jgi:outer membrane protein insertion porin family
MSFLKSFLFVIVACVSVHVVHAEEAAHLETLHIDSISILLDGKKAEPAQQQAILSRLRSQPGTLFSQQDFDEDLKLLSKEYEQVDPETSAQDHKLNITLHITSKPKIKAIIWEGNKQITQDKLEKELEIRPGTIFDRQTFNKALNKLKSFYIRKGYFEALLTYTTHKEPNNEVTIRISIKEGRAGEIAEIVFKGLSPKEEEQILELIYTKEYSLFTSWFTQEGIHKPEVLRHDELTIVNVLQNEGFADAKVTTQVLPAKKPGKIVIEITADKGKMYHFGDITISGEKSIPTQTLLEKIPFKKGDPFSPEKVRLASRVLFDTYGKKGFVDALVTPEIQLIENSNIYNVHIRVEEHARYRVGLIKVFGNTRTNANVILHETPLVPGEVFDTTLLQKTEEKLRNIGYFKNVNVYAVKSTEVGGSFRDVHIEVEENPTTAYFRTFIAYSTSPRQILGGLGVTESNFNITGIPHIFTQGISAIRGGGEYAGVEAQIGTKQTNYNLSWTKPYFLDTPWTVGVDLSKSKNEYTSHDYRIKTYSAQFFGRYNLNAFMKWGFHYRLSHSFVHLEGIRHKLKNRELIRESRNGGLISAIGPEFFYDSTDHPIAPTRGLKSTLSVEFAGLGGDHTFLNFAYINNFFLKPYEPGLLRFRANAQFIKTLGSTHPRDLPFGERLFLGEDIRGYHYNGVGPKFHDKKRTARGGVSQLLLSAQYEHKLIKRVDGFVFLDAGNSYFEQFHMGAIRYSTGYGIKVAIREGSAPLTVGFGYPLNPKDKRDVKHFFLSFGTSF